MKKVIFALAVLVLTGCVQHTNPQMPVSHVKSNPVDNDLLADLKPLKATPQSTALGIRTAIESKIDHPEKWQGKSCVLRLNIQQDGLLTAVDTESGDPAFCQAALRATIDAKIPPFETPELWQLFKNATLNFKL